MIEEFRDIVGYEGIYKVSNLGNVKSLARKGCLNDRILKPTASGRDYLIGKGYHSVMLRKNGKSKRVTVHKLVAMSFISHVPCGTKIVVDHIDENTFNNRLDNLQLLSNRANIAKGFKSKGGTSEHTGVCWAKISNKWRASIKINTWAHSLAS